MKVNIERLPCLAPFVSLNVRFSKYSICCNSLYEMNVNDNYSKMINNAIYRRLRKAMILQEDIPKNCQICLSNNFTPQLFLREEIVNIAKRNIDNMNSNYIIDNFNLGVLYLNFDRTCNLACRMCSSAYSSAYEKKIQPAAEKYLGKKNEFFNGDFNMLDEILKKNNLEYLEFHGGEPFLSKAFEKKLDLISSSELRVITNGMVYNDRIVQKLKRFEKVILLVSIDGNERVNNYIRIGSDLKTIKENILKFKQNLHNCKININITVSRYNIYFIPESLNEISSIKGIDDIHCHFVYDNNILRISSIESNEKCYLLKKLKEAKIKESKFKGKCLMILERVIEELVIQKSTFVETDIKAFYLFNKLIDQKYGFDNLHISEMNRHYDD